MNEEAARKEQGEREIEIKNQSQSALLEQPQQVIQPAPQQPQQQPQPQPQEQSPQPQPRQQIRNSISIDHD